MSGSIRMTEAEIERAVTELPGWERADTRIHKVFPWGDFKEAFSFMTHVAALAERHQHHPEWFNVGGTVEIWLTTHDVQGLTERDVALARAIDEVAR